MDDINDMVRFGIVYTRKRKRESTMKPLDSLITNDGVNQKDGKENSVHVLDNVKQPSPMVMFNGSSKPIWSGIFKINSKPCLKVDAHLSSIACKKVEECSGSLQPELKVLKLPRLQVWPKGWESSGPTGACIGLYFFPSDSRSNEVSDELVNEVIETDSALKVTAAIADLLIFPSVVLPEQNQLYHGKHYLWGLFRRRKDISDEVVIGGEQNGSTCAVPTDEGGQQAQHLLNQVDGTQPASSEQITCAMNVNHGENPSLVKSTCEAQIDEAMDSDIIVLGGEQNGSSCAMPEDEGGQQADQVDEAQPASSEKITCAMNDSHGENPPLVKSTCEAQIDEAMDSDTVVLGGEQNDSACAMPIDEGGQQADQVDEAQPASSEQITCVMYDSHVENTPLVESTCKAQIDEAMDSDRVVLGGEQNDSAYAMPLDERGQQADQVDEAQPASSEQITCVMYDSHVENPPLVESTCEAQIDEAMETVTEECLTTLPGSSLFGTQQPNSPKVVSNCSVHHPAEVRQSGDTFASSSTKPSASVSAVAEKIGHGQSCSGSEPLTIKLFGENIAKKPPRAQELIRDMATEGALVVSVPAEMVPINSVSGNSAAVGAGLNPGTDHQQPFEEVEPPQPDVEPLQACLELFPVREEQMGLAAPGVGTSNIMEVDLELRLGMPCFLHL